MLLCWEKSMHLPQCCCISYLLCVYHAQFGSLRETALLPAPLHWCCGVLMLFCWEKSTHLTVLLYISYLFICTAHSLFFFMKYETVLLLHENWNYCTKHVWCPHELQNKNFSMVHCTTWWNGAGKGRGWKTAAILHAGSSSSMSQAQLLNCQVTHKGYTCIADADSGALALTKQSLGTAMLPSITIRHPITQSQNQSVSHRPINRSHSQINQLIRIRLLNKSQIRQSFHQ